MVTGFRTSQFRIVPMALSRFCWEMVREGFSASAGSSPFAAGVNLLAVAVAVADFNGDGIQDIAVTNLTSNIVKVSPG